MWQRNIMLAVDSPFVRGSRRLPPLLFSSIRRTCRAAHG